MNVLRTSLVIITASALSGIIVGAPRMNRDLAPQPSPITLVPPTGVAPAARVAVADLTPDAHFEMASLEMYGPATELTPEETRVMIQRWRQLQARAVAASPLPKPEIKIAERDLHRPEDTGAYRPARRLEDQYRESGFYAQSRWAQRGPGYRNIATDRTPNGGKSIFSQSRWAGKHSGNYRRVGNRLIRQTNKRTTRYY